MLSGMSGYMSAVLAGMLFQTLNSCSPLAVEAWVRKFIAILCLPLALLSFSAVNLSLALLLISGDLYGSGVTATLTVLLVALSAVLVFSYGRLHINRA